MNSLSTLLCNPAYYRLMVAIATAIFVFFLGRHFVATYSLSEFLSTGDLHEYGCMWTDPTLFSRSFHLTDAYKFSAASPSVEQEWIDGHASELVCLLAPTAAYIVWKVLALALAASRRELIAILLGMAVGAIFAIVGCCIPEFQRLNEFQRLQKTNHKADAAKAMSSLRTMKFGQYRESTTPESPAPNLLHTTSGTISPQGSR